MTKQRGKRQRTVVIMVDIRGMVSPNSAPSRGLIRLIDRTAGWDKSPAARKDAPKACLDVILRPAKLPRPTAVSQTEKVMPMSSSLPENTDSSCLRQETCKSTDVSP